jgi:hypothetical protein
MPIEFIRTVQPINIFPGSAMLPGGGILMDSNGNPIAVFRNDIPEYRGVGMIALRAFINMFDLIDGIDFFYNSGNPMQFNYNDKIIQMTLGETSAYIDGVPLPIMGNDKPVAPINIDGWVYVPLRFLSEAFGVNVQWVITNDGGYVHIAP